MNTKTFEAGNLQFVFHDQDFWFDSYTIAKPELTQSGNWEVWSAEIEGGGHAQSIEEMELLAENRVLEIVSEDDLSYETIHLMISAYLIGMEFGEEKGRVRHQKMAKYAFDCLTGSIPDIELADAAETHYHRNGWIPKSGG